MNMGIGIVRFPIFICGGFMRLDKYLKVSRIIKRRTVANDACDASRIIVNGKPAKASYEVKLGDIIEVGFGGNKIKAEVLAISEYVKKEGATSLYRIIE
jgi:ribosomal 50S subunit-recycling heat shock protein